MKSMKKILAPIDLKEHSFATLIQAAEIARYADAQLVVLHVYHKPVLNGFYEKMMGPELASAIEKGRLSQLQDYIKTQYHNLIDAIPALADIRIKFIKERGMVVRKIIDIAETEQADLIIMGSHKVNALNEFWGSKAAEVCLKVKTPVLVLPYRWTLQKPEKIAFAYDLKNIRRMSDLDLIKLLSVMYKSEIHIITILAGNKISEQEKENIDRLKEYFAEFLPLVHTVPASDIEEGIFGYLRENKISLVTVLHRSRKLLEEMFHNSLTKRLVYHSDIPVLALDDRETT